MKYIGWVYNGIRLYVCTLVKVKFALSHRPAGTLCENDRMIEIKNLVNPSPGSQEFSCENVET
ncbi:hypothetical protein V7201_15240 [Bacillus sp. JJ1122]